MTTILIELTKPDTTKLVNRVKHAVSILSSALLAIMLNIGITLLVMLLVLIAVRHNAPQTTIPAMQHYNSNNVMTLEFSPIATYIYYNDVLSVTIYDEDNYSGDCDYAVTDHENDHTCAVFNTYSSGYDDINFLTTNYNPNG